MQLRIELYVEDFFVENIFCVAQQDDAAEKRRCHWAHFVTTLTLDHFWTWPCFQTTCNLSWCACYLCTFCCLPRCRGPEIWDASPTFGPWESRGIQYPVDAQMVSILDALKWVKSGSPTLKALKCDFFTAHLCTPRLVSLLSFDTCTGIPLVSVGLIVYYQECSGCFFFTCSAARRSLRERF